MLPDTDPREPSDAELLRAVAGGDEAAYGVLWTRHETAARRLAAQITRPSNVDDLVSEAFLRVLRAVKQGGGPDSAFRPYLFNTMRRFNIDTGRAYHQRVTLTDDDADLDVVRVDSAGDVYSADAEQQAAWRAWESLPDDTRTLLWHLIVEEETPAQIAPLLGVSPNGVSSRAVRAKERLRQAFLAQHLAQSESEECRRTRRDLGAYVRDALSNRDRLAADEHLRECRRCTAALAELRDVNMTLRLVIAPLLLGGSGIAAGYLATSHEAAAAATAAGYSRPLRAVRHLASKSSVAIGGTAVAACVAVAVAYAATGDSGGRHAVAEPRPSAGSGGHAPVLAPASSTAPASTGPSRTRTAPRPGPVQAVRTPTTAPPVPPASPTAAATSAPAHQTPTGAPTPTATPSRSPTPTPTPTATPTSTPTPTPVIVQRSVPITLPGGQLTGTVAVTLPAGWRLTSYSATGIVGAVGGDGVRTFSWVLLAARSITLDVIGPDQPAATLTGTVSTLAGSMPITAPLP